MQSDCTLWYVYDCWYFVMYSFIICYGWNQNLSDDFSLNLEYHIWFGLKMKLAGR